MEAIKLNQSQLDYLINELSKPSTFDQFQLVIGIVTMIALVITLIMQGRTAQLQFNAFHESKELALLDRKAKKAQYMPFVKMKFELKREQEISELGFYNPKKVSPSDFYLHVDVIKNTLTQPRFELESNIPGLIKIPVSIDPNAYWNEGESFDFSKVAHVEAKYNGFYESKERTYVRCIFIFEDMLGNPYSVAAKYEFPGGNFAAIEPTISRS